MGTAIESEDVFPLQQLTRLLAAVIGDAKSRGLVQDTARELRLPEDALDRKSALRIFAELGRQPGLIGLGAKRAMRQLETGLAAERKREPAPRAPTRVDVVAILSSALGDAKAERAVRDVCGFDDPRALSVSKAHAVLGKLSGETGVVGATARFAKARLELDGRAGLSQSQPP